MFEEQDYNSILARILNRMPEDEDVRPSSPLYILSGPAAKEIETLYKDLDYTLDQVFPVTAERAYLIKDALTYGISPYPATKSIVEGEFDVEIEIGDRFSRGGITFQVIEKLESGRNPKYFYYRLECERPGEIGNVTAGKLIPIWNIPNLKYAYLVKVLIPGEEEEETETFRERYLASFNNKRFGGNLSDYINEVCALEGVGRVKVLRCIDYEGEIRPEWVGIVITTSENKKPTEELIAQVQEAIQPLGDDSIPSLETSGLGIAPISHLVHVRGAEEEKIKVELKLTYSSGFSWESLQESIQEKIEGYLAELAGQWGDTVQTENAKAPMNTHLTVVRAKIESLIMGIEGILDANDTIINDEFENYNLAWDAIPVLESVSEHHKTRQNQEEGSCLYNCPDCAYNRNADECPRLQGD